MSRVLLTTVKAEMGVYPFMFGTAKDFEPIVEEMEKVISHDVASSTTTPDMG